MANFAASASDDIIRQERDPPDRYSKKGEKQEEALSRIFQNTAVEKMRS